jgi:hypothetical protein
MGVKIEGRGTSLAKLQASYVGVHGPCQVSGIFLPLRVNSLPLATIYEVKIPLRKWKKSFLQRNPAQMTWAHVQLKVVQNMSHYWWL